MCILCSFLFFLLSPLFVCHFNHSARAIRKAELFTPFTATVNSLRFIPSSSSS
ncbi:hypothetical protein BRYFOR_06050 [Marvinbryantia formatexigens DSM 14469]|uniref:Uncharacterized protein n=1 Tax=Marvinbryantia formatexigens DSM 14469 TaxID=478749 RepID=C6LBQ4_9FIRM|nr:hypothetical protein BRYFOR_06050 [Marvinbryantia formatexigens DSM 14469]